MSEDKLCIQCAMRSDDDTCIDCKNAALVRSYQSQLAAKDLEAEDLKLQLTDRNNSIDELCNGVWQIVYPGKTDWEYRTQPLVHIRQFVKEKDLEAEVLREQVKQLRALTVRGEKPTLIIHDELRADTAEREAEQLRKEIANLKHDLFRQETKEPRKVPFVKIAAEINEKLKSENQALRKENALKDTLLKVSDKLVLAELEKKIESARQEGYANGCGAGAADMLGWLLDSGNSLRDNFEDIEEAYLKAKKQTQKEEGEA